MRSFEEWATYMEDKIENKINEKRKERNIMKNKYLKLGTMAACLVLVIGAAAVIPYVANRNEAANPPETTVAVTEPAQTGDAVGGGESCTLHHNSYHSIPLEVSTFVANKVGAESVDKWFEDKWAIINSTPVEYPCRSEGFTITQFLRDFNITKEEFSEGVTFLVKAEYDADILYSEDEALIEEYFSDFEAREEDNSKIGNYANLTGELNIMYAEKMGIDIADAPRLPISDIVLKLGMEREELEAFIKKYYDMVIENDPSSKQFDYDLDGLYGEEADEKYSLEIDPEESVYERWVRLDALFCGVAD